MLQISFVVVVAMLMSGCFSFVTKTSEFGLKSLEDKKVNFNETLEFFVEVNNPDEIDLVLSADGELADYFDVDIGKFSWNPGYEDIGTYTITFSVTDGEEVDEIEITITVENKMFFATDFSEWEFANNRSGDMNNWFNWDHTDGIYFGVHTQNQHPDPASWWLSYGYETAQTIGSISFTYTSAFTDEGQQGRLILEIWDKNEEEPQKLLTETLPYDNSEGKRIALKDLNAKGGIELFYRRTDTGCILYPGSELRITDLELEFK